MNDYLVTLLRIVIVSVTTTRCLGQINKAPEFLPHGDMSRFSLKEDTPIGREVYTLMAVDPVDHGSKISYAISSDYFEVNRDSGVVKLIQALDREQQDTLHVAISATDESLSENQPNSVHLTREITILDANDNAPKFKNLPYVFSVDETTKTGTILFDDIEVVDDDSGANAEITLTCAADLNPKACEIFNISYEQKLPGKYQGSIILKSPLDYEDSAAYLLPIKAEDSSASPRKSSLVHIAIKVLDFQDQNPKFLNGPYFAAIAEGIPPEMPVLTIKVRDGDRGSPRPLNISIIDDIKNYFRLASVLNDSKGTHSVSIETSQNLLDREDSFVLRNDGQYIFRIKAVELEGGLPTEASSETTVTILITDVNDNQPTMSSEEYQVVIAEDAAIGSILKEVDLYIEDPDDGNNAKYTVSLESDDESKQIFYVHPQEASGKSPVVIGVANNSLLDYEKEDRRHFSFRIVATDDLGRQRATNVKVSLKDSNDNDPVFDKQQYVVDVGENSSPGTLIANITATDADSDSNGELSYSLQGFGAEWFVVNASTGEIRTADCGKITCLDYEKTNRYMLIYDARDGHGRAAVVQLVVNVIDANDNAPIFSQKELVRNTVAGVKEFQPPLVVKATDKDGSANGNNNLTYKIVDSDSANDTFSIDAHTGEITLQRALMPFAPTHFTNTFTLHVEASDGGVPPMSGDVFVVVTLTGTGDGHMFFTQTMYNASVLETALDGTAVIQVVAVDTTLKNPNIVYRIVSGARDNFVIDPVTGIVSVAQNTSLDLESSPEEYTVNVEASYPREHETIAATSTVHITVEDVNNKPPRFSQDFYVTHISEGAHVGSSILRVLATDADSDSLLQYAILEPVTARDRTGVFITSETDFDFTHAFHVNASSGELTLKSSLDHVGVSVIYIRIKVTDRNANNRGLDQTAMTEAIVYVEEVKDLNPSFPPPWTVVTPEILFSIPEEPPIHSVLFTLTAKNTISNLPITYTVLNETDNPYISVDNVTGGVTLMRRLDYEELPATSKHVAFVVKAEARNELNVSDTRTSTATVFIDVQDINDNSPVFSEQAYHATVPESATYPHGILTVKATDKDQQYSFGEIFFSLSGDGADTFHIDPVTGIITLARGNFLDRESKVSYNLKVTATDNPQGNGNQRRASALVFVQVLDVNDNAPKFSEPLYQAIIPEAVAPGFSIRHVHATDADVDASGRITYSLSNSSQLNGFLDVNATTGMLYVVKALSGKGRSEPYKVIVTATDHGDPALSADVHVLLFITDVSSNDGVPTFKRPLPGEVVTIPENSPIGSRVMQAEAVDPDDPSTDSGKLQYSFLGDASTDPDQRHFAIDPRSGIITTRSSLDRETQEEYVVVIMVKDLGRPPQQSARTLTIRVKDEDDHLPQFLRPKNSLPLEVDIEEEAALGTVVGFVDAADEDIGENAIIQYNIIGGNEDGTFAVNRTVDNRAAILVSGRMNREDKASYTLTIQAKRRPSAKRYKEGKHIDSSHRFNEEDGAIEDKLTTVHRDYDPTDLSMVQLHITILDIDDNPPVFVTGNTTTGIRANVAPGSEVFTFSAVDDDATDSRITYTLDESMFYFLDHDENKAADTVFALDNATGTLRTLHSMLDYENGYFVLQVAATSNGKSTNTSLTIFVLQGKELLRFVFNKPLAEVRKTIANFRQDLQQTIHSHMPLSLNLYDSHFAVQQTVPNVSSLCFQFVSGDSIMTPTEAEALLDLPSRPRLGIIYRNYGVENVEKCAVEGKAYIMNWMEISVLVIAALIAVISMACAIVVCHLHQRYKKKMKRTMYQVIRGAMAADTNGNGYSTIDRQRIHEWHERGTPVRDGTFGSSYA